MSELGQAAAVEQAGAHRAEPRAGESPAAPRPRKADADELPGLSRTLAAAFFADPVFTWWIPDRERRRQIEPSFFALIAEAYLPHGEVYTTDGLLAGAIWGPPGIEDNGDDLPAALEAVASEYAERAFTILELQAERHPDEPHHYLFFLGTRPEWQSQGIGSALMGPVLGRCDRDGMPAYLEATSERNRALYLRHGFEVTGEIRLPHGPAMWPMWREPN